MCTCCLSEPPRRFFPVAAAPGRLPRPRPPAGGALLSASAAPPLPLPLPPAVVVVCPGLLPRHGYGHLQVVTMAMVACPRSLVCRGYLDYDRKPTSALVACQRIYECSNQAPSGVMLLHPLGIMPQPQALPQALLSNTEGRPMRHNCAALSRCTPCPQ